MGFEPAISRFVVSRLIRWATGTSLYGSQIDLSHSALIQVGVALIHTPQYRVYQKITSTPAGFEPAHGDRNGLAGRRLNHSAKVSYGEKIFNRCSATGNRTPGICVTGRDVTNYTIADDQLVRCNVCITYQCLRQ